MAKKTFSWQSIHDIPATRVSKLKKGKTEFRLVTATIFTCLISRVDTIGTI